MFCAVVGFVIGAGCAAWVQRVDAPLTHGVVTAAGTYVVAQAVFVAIRLARGLDVQWFGVVFNLTVVTFAGVLGGFLGQRLRAAGVRARVERAPVTAILVIDVGTTTIRAAVVDEQLQIVALARRSFPPSTPAPGLVEFDAVAMYDVVDGRLPRGDLERRRTGAACSASRTSGRARWSGIDPPASRSGRLSAGRTCAP